MTELPKGWAIARLGDVAVNRDRERVPVNAKDRSARSGDVPYYGAAGQVGWIDRPLFDERLLLLGEDGVQFFDADKTKAYVVSGPSWVNNHAHVLSEVEAVSLSYLMHYLNQFDYQGYANGTTRLKLTRSAMDEIPVRLGPTAEQERIVAAIDEAFSKLDAGEAGLRRVRRLLERLRSSAIDAAIPQPGESGVRVARLGDLATDRSVGLDCPRARQSPTEGSHRYVRMGDIDANGKLNAGRLVWIRASSEEAERYALQVGDVLFNTRNSRELVGKTGLVDASAERALYNNNLLRIRFLPEISPRFAHLAMNGSRFREQLEKVKRATTSVAAVYSKDLVELEIAFPPADEQVRRVEAAERALSFVEAGERALDLALGRSTALRRSVLKAAFEGRLVPQDPSDEPASVLLDRIRAERSAQPVAKRRARQTA